MDYKTLSKKLSRLSTIFVTLIITVASFALFIKSEALGDIEGYLYSFNNADTLKTPTVQFFNGRVHVLHVGLDQRMYRSVCTLQGLELPSCTGWQAQDGLSIEPVGTAVFKGRLYEVHRGNNTLIYTRSSSDGNNWTGWKYDGGSTQQMITMTTFKDRLYQTHRGNGGQIFSRSTGDGNSWTGWQEISGINSTDRPIGLASTDNTFCHAHKGMNNKIYTRCSDNGTSWPAWQENSGSTNTAITLLQMQEGNNKHIAQFHRGDDAVIYTRSFDYRGWVRFAEIQRTNDFVSATADGSPTRTLVVANRDLSDDIFLEVTFY
jgi:hypothetical protein